VLGHLPEWFHSTHALACAGEKTHYFANDFCYRFNNLGL